MASATEAPKPAEQPVKDEAGAVDLYLKILFDDLIRVNYICRNNGHHNAQEALRGVWFIWRR